MVRGENYHLLYAFNTNIRFKPVSISLKITRQFELVQAEKWLELTVKGVACLIMRDGDPCFLHKSEVRAKVLSRCKLNSWVKTKHFLKIVNELVLTLRNLKSLKPTLAVLYWVYSMMALIEHFGKFWIYSSLNLSGLWNLLELIEFLDDLLWWKFSSFLLYVYLFIYSKWFYTYISSIWIYISSIWLYLQTISRWISGLTKSQAHRNDIYIWNNQQ